MCYSIAGYILRYDPTHGDTAVKDTASPYVLIRTVDCDGASITLCLSKEMDDLESVGLGPQSISSAKFDSDGRTAKKDKLRSLSTGAGVSIGDSQATVIKKLGKPTSRNKSTTVSGGTDFCYEYHPHAPQSGPYFEEDYTFKNGKLVRIEFSRSETD